MLNDARSSNKTLKVFVSYDPVKDQLYKNYFDALFEGGKDVEVVKAGQIDGLNANQKTEVLREEIRENILLDSTVTVVLIGVDTWKLKSVDWEIGAGLRDARFYPHSGLLGLVLPTYPRLEHDRYDPHTLPPRLNANLKNGFARLHNWVYDAAVVRQWLHEALDRREKVSPDNTWPHFTANLSGSKWKE